MLPSAQVSSETETRAITCRGGKRGLLFVLPLAGLFSSAASILSYSVGSYSWLLPGFVFGLFICGSFAVLNLLVTIRRVLGLMVVTTVAYPVSILLAGGIQLVLPWRHWSMGDRSDISAVTLCAAGFVGAFLVIEGTLLLVPALTEKGSLLAKTLCWSLLGGVLAVIGWKLGPSLGMRLWHMAHALHLPAPDETAVNATGDTSHQFSLWFVWQTGMGVVLAKNCRLKEVKQA